MNITDKVIKWWNNLEISKRKEFLDDQGYSPEWIDKTSPLPWNNLPKLDKENLTQYYKYRYGRKG